MKEKLHALLKEPNDKLICVDLDGTLCAGEFWGNGEPAPLFARIDFVNNLYKRGAHIIIYTARQQEHYSVTFAWLIKYGVMFHGMAMQHKPGADLYIDDKALNACEIDRPAPLLA
jgi:uncharacterized HAD superfamily protein